MLCDDRFRRRKIELNPEDMLDASECDGQRLSMFFQANAPNFFATLEELDTALSYLSDSDMMTGTWEVCICFFCGPGINIEFVL